MEQSYENKKGDSEGNKFPPVHTQYLTFKDIWRNLYYKISEATQC